jgi:hypothetical protein
LTSFLQKPSSVLLAQFGPEILRRINLDRGRVRPSFSVDVAAGAELYRNEQRSAAVKNPVKRFDQPPQCNQFC